MATRLNKFLLSLYDILQKRSKVTDTAPQKRDDDSILFFQSSQTKKALSSFERHIMTCCFAWDAVQGVLHLSWRRWFFYTHRRKRVLSSTPHQWTIQNYPKTTVWWLKTRNTNSFMYSIESLKNAESHSAYRTLGQKYFLLFWGSTDIFISMKMKFMVHFLSSHDIASRHFPRVRQGATF